MVTQVVSQQLAKEHSEADIHTAVQGGPCARADRRDLKEAEAHKRAHVGADFLHRNCGPWGTEAGAVHSWTLCCKKDPS